jgi:hypothetical protein
MEMGSILPLGFHSWLHLIPGRSQEQSALCVHGFAISGFKQLQIENIWGVKKKERENEIELPLSWT